ncbi:hypothetical protein GCM10008101_13350 [Lysobacter xinjiangensis]|uniref:Uncharacterized protein n=1 Tax=Cognatilysobacter xinjiangensis TaxID=546892 RepID=A0ABQ3BXP0_9GAMM|nr:hypothetical protein GCM10008101_13350 [Lysobacter xinjiangensis]
MHVVRHQHVGMHVAAVLERRLAELLPVLLIVRIARKAWLPVVATLDDVLRDAWQIESRESGHAGGQDVGA